MRNDVAKINFFIGHANQKIDGLEPFHKWFLKRRKNLKALVKRKGWKRTNYRGSLYIYPQKQKVDVESWSLRRK